MSHDDAFELLELLAIDALDDNVRSEVETHVEDCLECQSELDGLREVATALGTSVETPPEGLWNKISEHLYDSERGVPAVAPVLAEIPNIATHRAHRTTRRARFTISTVLVAAAAAILVLAINLAGASNRESNLQSALSSGAVAQALATPGHKVVDLTGSNKQELASFVVLKDGSGYLISSRMPTLPSSETYQLWGIVGGKPVSIGIMGSKPSHVSFTLASSPAPSALAVTVEPAHGSVAPTSPPVASATV